MSFSSNVSCLILASMALIACGSDDDGGGSSTGGQGGKGGASSGGTSSGGTSSGGTSSGGTSSGGTSTGGGAGAGGGAGTTGDGGACKSCSQMVITAESDLTKACSGNSSTLIQAFVTCTCQTDVCGGPGKGCEAACKGGQVDAACVACDQTAAAGPCKTQFDACMADQ